MADGREKKQIFSGQATLSPFSVHS